MKHRLTTLTLDAEKLKISDISIDIICIFYSMALPNLYNIYDNINPFFLFPGDIFSILCSFR